VLLGLGTRQPSALRAAFTDASTNIAAGATGTLFYRFRTPVASVGTTDHVVGLTDDPNITTFDFKAGLRNIVPSGVNQLDLRDGVSPGYEAVANLADNTWYSLWMVATNTNPGVHACYLQSDSDPNFAMQTLLVSGGDPFDFRIMGTTDIVNVLFRNANNAGGVAENDIYIDDIYINPSASDLSDPAVDVPCDSMVVKGDVNLDGSISFLDISPFIQVLAAMGFQDEADVNCDGVVSFLDIQPFITILANP